MIRWVHRSGFSPVSSGFNRVSGKFFGVPEPVMPAGMPQGMLNSTRHPCPGRLLMRQWRPVRACAGPCCPAIAPGFYHRRIKPWPLSRTTTKLLAHPVDLQVQFGGTRMFDGIVERLLDAMSRLRRCGSSKAAAEISAPLRQALDGRVLQNPGHICKHRGKIAQGVALGIHPQRISSWWTTNHGPPHKSSPVAGAFYGWLAISSMFQANGQIGDFGIGSRTATGAACATPWIVSAANDRTPVRSIYIHVDIERDESWDRRVCRRVK